MNKSITEIYCPNCGAPAKFDIIKQRYLCGYCGSKVEIKDAQIQKQGFRKIRSDILKKSSKNMNCLMPAAAAAEHRSSLKKMKHFQHALSAAKLW